MNNLKLGSQLLEIVEAERVNSLLVAVSDMGLKDFSLSDLVEAYMQLVDEGRSTLIFPFTDRETEVLASDVLGRWLVAELDQSVQDKNRALLQQSELAKTLLAHKSISNQVRYDEAKRYAEDMVVYIISFPLAIHQLRKEQLQAREAEIHRLVSEAERWIVTLVEQSLQETS